MKIKIDYIETPVQEIKVSFKEAGRRGGLAKVPKGFSKMPEEKRKEIAKKAAAKRWGKNE
jgi:hypothetical protein